jgi:predicted TIM-barrel fold metal-dependent hydrolase
MTTTTTQVETPNTAQVKYRAFDCDGHFKEPDELWAEYLPAEYRAMAPRFEVDSMGQRRFLIGGKTLPRNPMIPLPRRESNLQEDLDPLVLRSGFDPQARLAVMDSEGIDVNVIYPTTGLRFAAVDNLEVLVALCQAYNNWAKDFCSAAPDRLLAPAVVPQLDVSETLKETRRAVEELGLAGVMLRPNPIGRTIEDPAWGLLWSLLEELDAPLGFHEGSSLPGGSWPGWPGVAHLGSDRTDNHLFQHAMSHPFEHMAAMLALIAGGTLERHPNLRVLFLEAGCGWVPYWLERMDHHLAGGLAYTDVRLPLSATEYFQRQCFVSMDPEEGAVVPALVSCVGADNVCWSTDFPHTDHEWRGMARDFASREDLSEEAKEKIIGGNAARAYKR